MLRLRARWSYDEAFENSLIVLDRRRLTLSRPPCSVRQLDFANQ